MTTHRAPPPALLAPGSAGSSVPVRAPGRHGPLPAVDDRLVAPESRAEIVDGRVYRTMGANEPHAVEHLQIARVFGDCLSDGYAGAVDMLTRSSEDTDAAPDVSVFPVARDPATGGRQLEEIAFEVLGTERMSHATDKVEKLAARGVRRIFCIRVESRAVYEWSHEHHDWAQLDSGASIEDRCFRVPVPVGALVDRVLADDTVARALLRVKNRVLTEALERARAEAEARGKAEGMAEGKAEGMADGRRATLRRLLRLKFQDALAADVLDRLDRASDGELDQLEDTILTATSPDQLLR